MTKIIELTMYPFNYPIIFEVTGIEVAGTTQDRNGRAIVNDVTVNESYREVLYKLL